MKSIKYMFSSKVGVLAIAGAFILVSAVLFIAPRQINSTKAENCQPVYSEPVFNPYPVSWTTEAGTNCLDFPIISGNVVGAGFWDDSFTAKAGDTIKLRIYVHNGAALNSGAIMRGVKVSSTADLGAGSSHVIRTTLSASNASSKAGSVRINTGPNDRLEVISGSLNHSIGDMEPCFPYSKVFYIELKVVSDQPEEPKTLDLSAKNFCVGDKPSYTVNGSSNLANEYLRWSSTKNGQSTGENQSGYGHILNSNGDWSGQGSVWTSSDIGSWTKTAHAGGVSKTTSFKVEDCSPPVVKTLSLKVKNFCVGDTPYYTVTGSDGLANEYIRWSSTLNGQSTGEVQAGYSQYTNSSGDWSGPSSGSWKASHIGNWTKTAHVGGVDASYSFKVEDCSPPVVKTLDLSAQNFCVGDKPSYTVNGSSNLANEYLRWSSTKNGQSTGENQSGYGHTLNSNGDWSGQGSVWTSSDIGSWTKTAHAGGVSKTTSFKVEDCSPPVPTLTCSPSNQTRDINQTANFSANGGTGSYSWSTSNSSNNSGSGKNFSTSYFTSGSKTVKVTSGSQTANCGVYVNPPIYNPPTPTCPLTSGANRTIVYFNKNIIVAWGNADEAKDGPYSVNLPSGEYDVTLVSFDDHVGKSGQIQPREQYYVSLMGNGSEVARSNSIADLPDSQNYLTQKVNSGLFLPSGVNSVTAYHPAFYDSNPNSIVPVCAAFDKLEEEPKDTSLSITKEVKNLTSNGNYSSSTNAESGDTVQYRIIVKNVGNITAQSVSISDNFDNAGISRSGSLNVSKNYSGTLSNGINVGDLGVNQTVTVIYNATVNIENGTVTNTAIAGAGNAPSVSDTAAVYVATEIGQPQLTIEKTVRNLTQGNVGFVGSVSAYNGDEVEFKIVVDNVGNAEANNVIIKDDLPGGLSTVSDSLGTNVSVNGQLTGNGLELNKLSQGQSAIIYFRAKVNVSSGNLTNTARAWADNASEVSDSAYINLISQPSGSLSINKLVKNVTKGTGFSSSVSADSGNRVEFEITVTAFSGAVNNVRLTDSMPNDLTLVNGSVRLDGSGVSDSSFQSGLNLGNITAGQSRRVTFEAFAYAQNNVSQTVITNTATASSDNVGTVDDSATVYISQQIDNGFGRLTISKSVKKTADSYYQNSVNVNSGETVSFEITVNNTGTRGVDNVRVRDFLPSGLEIISGSLRIDGSSGYSSGSLGDLSLGSLYTGQQKRIYFDARVSTTAGQSIQNIARVSGDSVSEVQDDAWVFISQVQGGNVNLSFSKRAVNDTKNSDAQTVTASREDFITYTLTVTNNGNSPATSFVITDDLSQVLRFADMVDNGGGSLNGSVLSYPAITVPAYGSVSKSFKVRVKYSLESNLSYTMVNTYGNTVTVRINTPQILGTFIAPKTGGPSAGLAGMFGAFMTGAFAIVRHRKKVINLIWN